MTARRVVRVHLFDKGAALLASRGGPLLETHRRQLAHVAESELAALGTLPKWALREPPPA